jgi:hypothetical protein
MVFFYVKIKQFEKKAPRRNAGRTNRMQKGSPTLARLTAQALITLGG